MEEWVDPAAEARPSLDVLRSEGVQNLVLSPSEDQFNNWTAAFKASKYDTFHEWAVAGLEAFAREEEQQKTIAFPPGERKSDGPARVVEADGIPPAIETPVIYLTRRGSVAAGGRSSADVTEEEMPVGKTYPKDHYALRVLGQSMEPKIPDGSTIVVKMWRDGYPKKGTVVVYNDGHGATLKVYDTEKREDPENAGHKVKVPVLRSLNPEYPDVEPIEGGKIDAVLVEVL